MPGPQLQLPGVALVAVTSVAIDATARAVSRSMEGVEFAQAIWFSDQAPPALLAGRVIWRKIERLTSRAAYSQFMLRGLGQWVETPHILTVQWDGFVTDPNAWDPTCLDYDFVGAPWPHFGPQAVVGNGGFSLRSKRLLDALEQLPIKHDEPEDVAICRTWRGDLVEHHHIRFAPPDLAQTFSRERMPAIGPSFGFHGIFNMGEFLDDDEMLTILRTFEPELIARNELGEVFRAAVVKRRWAIARAAGARIIRAPRR